MLIEIDVISSIHLILLSTYYVTGTALNKPNRFPVLPELIFYAVGIDGRGEGSRQ